MSTDGDLIKLYSGQILALAADIPRLERLAAPTATIKKRSPLCGSTITVDVDMKDGTVTGFGQDVKACALGQAAASVVGANIIGRSHAEIVLAQAQLKAMLKEDGPAPGARVQKPSRLDHAGARRSGRGHRIKKPPQPRRNGSAAAVGQSGMGRYA
jgi:NifU-like protein involved in Fe-S cluster formation